MISGWGDISMRTGFYRNTARGKIAGVCAGISDRMGIRRTWVRIGFVVLTLVTHGFWIVAYLLLAIMLQPREAAVAYARAPGYGGAAYAPAMPAGPLPMGPPPAARVMDVRTRFTALEARLSRIEAVIMSEELSLRRKFRDLGSD